MFKKIVLSTVFAVLSTIQAEASPRVLMFVNEGFQPDEYFVPRAEFEKAGFEVKVATRYKQATNPSRNYPQQTITPDYAFSEVDLEKFDAITFTGGQGAWTDFMPNKKLHEILKAAVERKMTVGLICAATGLLATANNLSGETPMFAGQHVTGYSEVEGLLKYQGKVNFETTPGDTGFVVTDGQLVTGKNPKSSTEFARTIIGKLKSSVKK